ncbi:MAG: flavin reductase [Solirubrobacteraceae bacterium]|nr:flavin reductase [Solirubrobacteraceae bacterium]
MTVITTRGEDHAYGMTATAFSSVSMDPPLVLVCVKTNAEGSGIISANGVFAVNVLAADQEPISNYFASRDRPRGRDALKEVPHTTAQTGSPRIDGVAAFLDCRLAETHESGDHLIFIGEVLALDVDASIEPLLFHGSRYRRVHDG